MSITSLNDVFFLFLKRVPTLIRLECGSVQMNPASTSFTLFSALSLRKHSPNNSLDSREHDIHSNGGCRYRSQLRQNCNVPCLGMSCVMSTCVRRHDTHMLAGFGSMVTPHWQHNLNKHSQTFYWYRTTFRIPLMGIRTFWPPLPLPMSTRSPLQKVS